MRGALIALVICFVVACSSKRSERAPAAGSGSGSGSAVVSGSAPPRAPRSWTRPPFPPRLPASAEAWSAAEAKNTPEAWDAAAAAYEQERASCTSSCMDAAYAVMLARRQAMMAAKVQPPPGDETVPLPPRAQAVLDAIDAYLDLADPADPDRVGMEFLATNVLAKWRQPDAIARLEAFLRTHRDDPSAEYAANVLLDLLNKQDRVPELRAWVDELLADSAFLVGKDQLRKTLEQLRAMLASKNP